MNKVIKIGICFLLILLGLQVTFADQVQESCFETMKENVAEIKTIMYKGEENEFEYNPIFIESATPTEDFDYFQNLKYGDLKFSKYYKTSKLLGVELDEPLFEQRFFTFGKETGLNTLTPFSPFVDGKMTEKFEEELKMYVIEELYSINQEGEQVFLGCGINSIDTENLDSGKNDYLYDEESFSILKTAQDLNYKALYSENSSVINSNDYYSWSKIFVFPKDTKNSYFNFYDVIDDYSLRGEVSNFQFDNFDGFQVSGKVIIEQNYNLWKAIEKNFPKFAEHLAFKGELYFDTLKRLLTTKENPIFENIWDVVLDSKGFIKYLYSKEKGTLQQKFAGNEGMIEYYEYNEKWLEDMELKIISLLDEQDISYIDENIVVEDEKNGKYNIPIVVNVEKNIPTKDNVSIFLLSILGILLLGVIGIGFNFLKKKK